MAGLLACLLVLLVFNLRGKLFLGDCGSYGIAAIFGLLAVSLHQDAFGTVRSAEVMLLFLIPVLDTLRLLGIRLMNGRSPFSADRNHLHHLLDKAIGWTRGWFVYMGLIVVPLIAYQLFPGLGVPIILAAVLTYAYVVWRASVSVDFNLTDRAQLSA